MMEDRRNFLTWLFAGTGLVALFDCDSSAAQKIPDVNPGNQSAARQISREKQPVIPLEVIQEFNLKPLQGTGPWMEGEDGRFYSIDDCLRVLFKITEPHWQRQRK